MFGVAITMDNNIEDKGYLEAVKKKQNIFSMLVT